MRKFAIYLLILYLFTSGTKINNSLKIEKIKTPINIACNN